MTRPANSPSASSPLNARTWLTSGRTSRGCRASSRDDDHLEAVADEQDQPEDDVEGELDPPVARLAQALGQRERDDDRGPPADDLGQAQRGEVRGDPAGGRIGPDAGMRPIGRGTYRDGGRSRRKWGGGHARSHFPVSRPAASAATHQAPTSPIPKDVEIPKGLRSIRVVVASRIGPARSVAASRSGAVAS